LQGLLQGFGKRYSDRSIVHERVRSTDYPKTINWRKLMAIIGQIASWFTTLWFVHWVWAGGPLPYLALIAVIAEALLVVLKERLFRGDDPALGWAGLVIDGLINAGGILPKACRIVTFPPIAADRCRVWDGRYLHRLQLCQRGTGALGPRC
jgi:hypothetical protein